VFTRFQRFYNGIKLLSDMSVLALAFGLAYFVRFHLLTVSEAVPSLFDSTVTGLLALVLYPLTFRQLSLYTTNRSRTHVGEVFEILKATLAATVLLVTVTYFFRERYSRGTILLFMAFAFLGVASVRLFFRSLFNSLRSRGFNVKRVLVVGAGTLGQRVVRIIHQHRELGFEVVGYLTRRAEKVGQRFEDVAVLGEFEALSPLIQSESVDQVILALPLEEQVQLKSLMEDLAQHTVDVKVVPDLFSYVTLRGGFEEFGGLPMISLQSGPLHGWNLVLKRAFDIVMSLSALVLVSPLLLVLSVLVKVTSRGPVFFRQERMGMDGHLFNMYKFRTMRVDAEAAGPRFATSKDDRRTPIGAVLRRLSLDELPQFLNVLKGDMSLVGPRPERPVFIESFRKEIPRYHLRHMVKAGVTGWAQINGLRGDTSIRERIDYDLFYIENWSLTFDIKILVRTALGGFLSKNAY
jgi:Undecaprenyl-phosphate glucose phosphotransferase